MASGGHISGKQFFKTIRTEFRKFVDRGFDWIALVVITMIILLTLVLF
ncbi:hypothetical protein [Dyadobacter aurulentus]|nr:hypothetical protein [Dyadobacter sp. UC 10]